MALSVHFSGPCRPGTQRLASVSRIFPPAAFQQNPGLLRINGNRHRHTSITRSNRNTPRFPQQIVRVNNQAANQIVYQPPACRTQVRIVRKIRMPEKGIQVYRTITLCPAVQPRHHTELGQFETFRPSRCTLLPHPQLLPGFRKQKLNKTLRHSSAGCTF